MKLLDHLYVKHGGEDNNIKTTCLFCGAKALSIDSEAPHQYQCFGCKATGNAFTFIRRWYDQLPKLTKEQAMHLSGMKKGVKPIILRNLGVRYAFNCFWFPVYNTKGHLMAIHKYSPETNIVYSSPKPTSLTVIGLQNLTSSDTVWVAEGHWDYAIAMGIMNDSGTDLLGTCGSYFHSSQLVHLKNKHIVLLYDNDPAGVDGIDYVARNLKSNSIPHLSLSYLDWNKITIPSGELGSGFDIRDLYNAFAG